MKHDSARFEIISIAAERAIKLNPKSKAAQDMMWLVKELREAWIRDSFEEASLRLLLHHHRDCLITAPGLETSRRMLCDELRRILNRVKWLLPLHERSNINTVLEQAQAIQNHQEVGDPEHEMCDEE